ncbi:hypothetical protein, partial [Pseudomonas aeruginosa]
RAWQPVLVSDLASGRLVLPDARDLDRLNLPKSTLPDENKVEDSDPLAAKGDLADLHVYRRQAARIDGGQRVRV